MFDCNGVCMDVFGMVFKITKKAESVQLHWMQRIENKQYKYIRIYECIRSTFSPNTSLNEHFFFHSKAHVLVLDSKQKKNIAFRNIKLFSKYSVFFTQYKRVHYWIGMENLCWTYFETLLSKHFIQVHL